LQANEVYQKMKSQDENDPNGPKTQPRSHDQVTHHCSTPRGLLV